MLALGFIANFSVPRGGGQPDSYIRWTAGPEQQLTIYMRSKFIEYLGSEVIDPFPDGSECGRWIASDGPSSLVRKQCWSQPSK